MKNREQFIWSERGCWLFTVIDGKRRTSFVGIIKRESLQKFCRLHRIEFIELADAVALGLPGAQVPALQQAA